MLKRWMNSQSTSDITADRGHRSAKHCKILDYQAPLYLHVAKQTNFRHSLLIILRKPQNIINKLVLVESAIWGQRSTWKGLPKNRVAFLKSAPFVHPRTKISASLHQFQIDQSKCCCRRSKVNSISFVCTS